MGTVAIRTPLGLFVAVFALLMFVALPSWAQSDGDSHEPAEITKRQVELNEEGVRAIISGDHQKAVAVLSESLAYGEANATYLNLGRAYQKLGNCKEAREALEQALTAPVVDDPPPRVIDKKANEYLGELDEECPDEEPADEAQSEEQPQAEKEPSDPAGAQSAPAADEPENARSVEDPGPSPDTDAVDSGGNGLAWASIGVGAAFVGGGVAMHLLASQQRAPVYDAGGGDPDVTVVDYDDLEAQDREQRANLYDTIGLSADIAGGALIGVGVVLLLTNSDSPEASSFLVAPTRGGAAATYRISF